MSKKIFASLLVTLMLVFCLPISGWAADISAENALFEKFSNMRSYQNRVEGEIIVDFKEDIPYIVAYDILADACASAYKRSDEAFINSKIDCVDWSNTQLITVPDESIEDVMISLYKNPAVKAVEPNGYVELSSDDYSIDESFPQSYDPGNSSAAPLGQWHLDRIGVQDSWDAQFGGSNTTIVAVLDTGYATHSELTDVVDMSLAYNVVDYSTDVTDINGHGTMVSGIIGASVDGIGTNGICAEIKIAPIKISLDDNEDGSNYHLMKRGIDRASLIGATVVNLSWTLNYGYSTISGCIEEFGKLVVFAADNDNREIVSGMPKANDDLLWVIVGASDYQENRWYSSVNIGSNYSSIYVDLFAPGAQIYTTDSIQNSYAAPSGTSCAAPMVTAAIAILASHAPHLTPAQIKSRLIETCDQFDAYDGLCVSGGRLNLYNAVLATYAENRGAYSRGDVNGDGYVTSTDYAMIKRVCLGTLTFNATQSAAADINGDGEVSSVDYAMAQRYVLRTWYFTP